MTVWLLIALMLTGICWLFNVQARRAQLGRPLVQAVLSRDTVRVNALLDQGANPNVRYATTATEPAWKLALDSLLRVWRRQPRPKSAAVPTALMIASLGGNTATYGSWYDYPEMETQTAQWDQTAIVQALLKHGADPNATDEHNWTPLRCASVNDNVNIARCLLDHGADVNEKCNFGTALMDAAGRNEIYLVRLFLQRGANVNAQDDGGMSAIIAACDADSGIYKFHQTYQRGSAAIVQLLIEHGANVNLPCRYEYPSALMTAVYNRNPAVVQLLLAHGAHVNSTNYDGLTAMMLIPRIFSGRDLAILNMLTANGARINAASYDGNTPLTWAADKDDIRTVGFLLAHGADVSAVNRAGHTALWFAANNGNTALSNLLRSHGATVRGGNGRGAALPPWGAGNGNWDIRNYGEY